MKTAADSRPSLGSFSRAFKESHRDRTVYRVLAVERPEPEPGGVRSGTVRVCYESENADEANEWCARYNAEHRGKRAFAFVNAVRLPPLKAVPTRSMAAR